MILIFRDIRVVLTTEQSYLVLKNWKIKHTIKIISYVRIKHFFSKSFIEMQVTKGYLLSPFLVELIAHSKCGENGDGEERGRERDCKEDALGAGARTRGHRRASPFAGGGVDA